MPARHMVGNSATLLAGVTLNSALQQNLALEQAAPIGGRRRAHCCRPRVHRMLSMECTVFRNAPKAIWLPCAPAGFPCTAKRAADAAAERRSYLNATSTSHLKGKQQAVKSTAAAPNPALGACKIQPLLSGLQWSGEAQAAAIRTADLQMLLPPPPAAAALCCRSQACSLGPSNQVAAQLAGSSAQHHSYQLARRLAAGARAWPSRRQRAAGRVLMWRRPCCRRSTAVPPRSRSRF